jgi:hypothetical protein
LSFGTAVAQSPATGFKPAPKKVYEPISCSGPTPQVHIETLGPEVKLWWDPVPGANLYNITRTQFKTFNTVKDTLDIGPASSPYWDSVPDPKTVYEYTITATQISMHCVGATNVYASDFDVSNGGDGAAVRTAPSIPQDYYGVLYYTDVTLKWEPAPGAIGYKIYGPGFPAQGWMVSAASFTSEKGLTPAYSPGLISDNTDFTRDKQDVAASTTCVGCMLAWRLRQVTLHQGDYSITALYPNNISSNPRIVTLHPPAATCSVTSESSWNGPIGTSITVNGSGFSLVYQAHFDAPYATGDGGVNPKFQYPVSFKILSDSQIAIDTSSLLPYLSILQRVSSKSNSPFNAIYTVLGPFSMDFVSPTPHPPPIDYFSGTCSTGNYWLKMPDQ